MSPDQKKISRLAKLTEELNAETDALNSTIETLEKRLSDNGVGVSVWLDDDLSLGHATLAGKYDLCGDWYQGTNNATYKTIGYAKINDAWRICIAERESFIYDEGNDRVFVNQVIKSHEKPLINASRLERIEAAAMLDQLLDALTEKVEEHIKNVKAARKIAQ